MKFQLNIVFAFALVSTMAFAEDAKRDANYVTGEMKEAGSLIEASYQPTPRALSGVLASTNGEFIRYFDEVVQIIAPEALVERDEFTFRFAKGLRVFGLTIYNPPNRQIAYFRGRGRCLLGYVDRQDSASLAAEILYPFQQLCSEVSSLSAQLPASGNDFFILLADLAPNGNVVRVRTATLTEDATPQVIEVPVTLLLGQRQR